MFKVPTLDIIGTFERCTEICRLQDQVKHSYKTLTDIIALAEELKMGTIEKVMEKSNLKLGIESLKKYL